jgi:hypothetical protein
MKFYQGGFMKKRMGFSLDKDVYDDFRSYCKKNAFKISAKLELMMMEAMKGQSIKEKSYPTLVKMFQDMIDEQSKGKNVVSRIIEVKSENPKRFSGKIPSIDELKIRKRL